MELTDVERKLRIRIRPWHAEKPKIDWKMTAYVPAGKSAQKAKAVFGVALQKYAYIDGSKDDEFTGLRCTAYGRAHHLLKFNEHRDGTVNNLYEVLNIDAKAERKLSSSTSRNTKLLNKT